MSVTFEMPANEEPNRHTLVRQASRLHGGARYSAFGEPQSLSRLDIRSSSQVRHIVSRQDSEVLLIVL